jgi:putative Mg2+ transporter-C (MgtC) family protein
LKEGVIRGITTAAGLWTVAAIGLAAGGGMYFAASAATVLCLIILWILQPFEKKVAERYKPKTLKIITPNRDKSLQILNELLLNTGLNIVSSSVSKVEHHYVISISLNSIDLNELQLLMNTYQIDPDVQEVSLGVYAG